MCRGQNRVCPVERAGFLDNRLRRWVKNPQKILGPYLKPGMIVLDFGCGPGFFSLEIGRLVGKSGRVIAADLQEGMLQKVSAKIRGTELESRITLHQCQTDKIGLSEIIDFVLAFYMVHEVPSRDNFFTEIRTILKPEGHVLIVEPTFHVSKQSFVETLGIAQRIGFTPVGRPKVLFSKAVLLQRNP